MAHRILENDELKVVIADEGAELISLWDKRNQRELIWEADPSVWNRHAPVLFPFVGKVNGGVYRHKGVVYEMKTQHGYARDALFTCVKEGEGEVIHRISDTEETKRIYPFSYDFCVIHCLEGRTLTVRYAVKNTGKEEMIYSVGGHPGFRIKDGTKRSDYSLRFEGKESLDYILIDPEKEAADPSKVYTLELTEGCCKIDAHMFDKDALIFDGNQVQKAEILQEDGSPYICVETEEFPSFGIWSKPDGAYVCLEPWAGRVDDVGFEGELSEKPYVQKLAPGCERTNSYRITV